MADGTEKSVEELEQELARERSINDDLRNLARVTGDARKEPEPEAYKPWYERLPEDTYDERQVELARRMDSDLRGVYNPVLEELRAKVEAQDAEIKELRKGNQATGEHAGLARFETAMAELGTEIGRETFGKLRGHKEFLDWAETADFTTGAKYNKLINHALNTGQPGRAARIIRMWPGYEVFAGLAEPPKDEVQEHEDESLLKLLDGGGDEDAAARLAQAEAEERARVEAEEQAKAEAEAKAKAEAAKIDPTDSRSDMLDLDHRGGRDDGKVVNSGDKVAWTPERIERFKQQLGTGHFDRVPNGAEIKARLFASLEKYMAQAA